MRYVEEPEFGLMLTDVICFGVSSAAKTLFQDSRNCAMMLEQINKTMSTSILSILKIPTSGDIGKTPQDANRYSQ